MNAEQSHTISQVGDNTPPEAAVSKSRPSGPPISGYNMRSPAVKRLMREAAELCNPETDFAAHPTEANLFEWHFTIRGPESSEFENGVYHGRIIFPSEYPMKPPSFILLTPNGRFQTEEKICLSISNYHPETWLPSWSIRTALVALRSFMTTPGNEGAIGSLNFSVEERKKLANKSKSWECHDCGLISKLVLPLNVKKDEDASKSAKVDGTNPVTVATSASTSTTSSQVQVTCGSDMPPNSKQVGNGVATQRKTVPSSASVNAAAAPINNERTDNQNIAAGSSRQTADVTPQRQQNQQNESIKNILYDFGIACFVILILGLCLRRLFVIFESL